MSILGNRVLGGAGQQPYLVGRSLRFRSSASAYLNRTPASASNRKTWTWSGWVKRGDFGTNRPLLSAYSDANNRDVFQFDSAVLQYVNLSGGSVTANLQTTSVYRDPSAWYHIVLSVDTTQATSSNRIKLYVNGVQVTVFTTATYPSQNADMMMNNNVASYIGREVNGSQYFEGYLAEVNFIDGQALTPSSFGAYDNNGVWQPRKYGGTYGTNGFYLNFSDNNGSTATTIGKDYSGNGNNWTPNNISVVFGTSRYLGSISGSIDTVNGGPESSMFKGSTAAPAVYPNPGATLTWNPYASVPFTSTARVYIGVDVNGPANGLVVNSTNYGNGGIAGNAFGWVNVASAGSPITSISWSRASGGSQGIRVYAVEIDGTILVDGPSWNPLYDSMVDSPTLYSDSNTNRGNYATLNPLRTPASTTISNGNLSMSDSTNNHNYLSTIGMTSGKWYFEFVGSASGFSAAHAGIAISTISPDTYIGSDTNGYAYHATTGQVLYNNSSLGNYSTWSAGDVIGIAYDADGGKLYVAKNNSWQNSGNPAAGTGAVATGIASNTWFFGIGGNPSALLNANFGQRPFSYTPPSGFNALNTYNLPQPTIMNGAKYMAATTYSGSASQQTISNNVNNAGFQPDLVWAKVRSNTYNHALLDVIRGQNYLSSNTTTGDTATGGVSLISNGVTWPGGASLFNDAGQTYVAWQWNAGSGVTSTNTNGSISSLVSVNPTAGFSIVNYIGTGAVATVGHSLGVAPNMIIWKNRSSVENWVVYHSSLGATGNVYLNLTNGFSTDSTTQNNTAPTSSVFTVATSGAVNGSTRNIIAYCFSAVAGYSAFGSYTGNGSADGPFVYTGFRPRWLLIKQTSASGLYWNLMDSSRSPYNAVDKYLSPNATDAESTYGGWNFLSNGFKLVNTGGSLNASGATYIYAAFAENPFKVSRAY